MSNPPASARAQLLFDPGELDYDFGPDHPMQPRRLLALMDLLERCGLWQSGEQQKRLPLRAATIEELGLVHTPDYIAAVQQLSISEAIGISKAVHESRENLALKYGFGDGDTPALPGMHEAAARIAGGTLVALSAIMGLPEGGMFASEDDRPLHVFHPAGGFHHAWAERASGFCVYNDISIAIAHVLRATEAKVLYLDFDAHHGDGVQRSFYDDPRVMTVSFHETGRYLFPGTGDILELGNGSGRGYSVNIPLEPFTEDDSYIEAMNSLLPPLALSFAPDVIVSAHGCDTHAWDPLTHLELTLRGIQAQIKLVHQLAHSYCQGRWVALGSGGYDPYRVVPRAWGMLWTEMSGKSLPEHLPEEWVKRWRPVWLATEGQEEEALHVMGKESPIDDFPTTFLDRAEDFPAQPRRFSISQTNRQTVTLLRHLVLPTMVRHAFPATQRQSPMAGLFDLLHPSGTATSRTKTLETLAGQLLLRDFCPPSLVERLKADSGLHAFARLPEREHQLLLSIAKSPDCELALAHTPAGEIVGQVTLAPGDDWWVGFENIYEVTIEVSSNWRGAGLARHLLAFALELDESPRPADAINRVPTEDMILFAMGLSWHWDTEGLGISVGRYRKLIARLFESQGFVEHETTEPNISMEPGNILLVRIGKNVDEYVVRRFLSSLRSPVGASIWAATQPGVALAL